MLNAKASRMHVLVLDVSIQMAMERPWQRNWHYIPYKLDWHYVPILRGRKVAIAGPSKGMQSFDADTIAVRALPRCVHLPVMTFACYCPARLPNGCCMSCSDSVLRHSARGSEAMRTL